jgi:uncharacterized SAM-binding protein YcdF (DUF218 family)
MLRAVRFLQRSLAVLGGLLVLVTVTPPHWYLASLGGKWHDPAAPVMVLLGAGSNPDGTMDVTSYWRAYHAAYVWNAGSARHVIISGDARTVAAMRDWLVWRGVPGSAVTLETNSRSTRENALHTAELLRKFPQPVELLSSDYHLWRAERAFVKAGAQVTRQACPDAVKRGNDWRLRWQVFLDFALEVSKIGYYRLRGWI